MQNFGMNHIFFWSFEVTFFQFHLEYTILEILFIVKVWSSKVDEH